MHIELFSFYEDLATIFSKLINLPCPFVAFIAFHTRLQD